jgi:predicted MFS family arabinose efflux permease
LVRALSLNGRGGQLVLLAVVMAAVGYARTVVSPLQEAMRIALSLTDNEMSLLQGPVIGIPMALTAIPLGLLIDRYSRVRLLFALVTLSVVGSLLTALTSDFVVLLLARCLAGVMGLAVLPVVFSLLADLFPPERRGRATTVMVVGQTGGNSAAFALGGSLLAMSGPDVDGWRWAMWWLIAPLGLVLFAMAGLREPPRLGQAIRNPTAREVWDELRHYRAMIAPIAVGVILAETAVGAMLIWSAPMLSRLHALAPDRVGAILAMGILVSGVLGPAIGGGLADVCQRTGGPRRSVAVLGALALLSAFAGLFAFVPGVALASGMLVAAMTLVLAIAVMGMTLFTIVIPNELRGLCMSVLVALEILFALAVAPPLVSILSGAMGGEAMIGSALSVVCAATGLLGAVVLAVGRRYFQPAAGAVA